MQRFLFISIFLTIISLTFKMLAIEPDELKLNADTLMAEKVVFQSTNPPLIDSIISFSKKYMHYRYKYGSSKNGASGFDCSGFTSFVYSKFGYSLSPSSAAQAKQFPNIKKKEIRPGDLVFYAGRGGRSGVGHVGLVTEVHSNGEFNFIHATNGAGVIVSKSTEAYYSRRYRTAGRVLPHDSLFHSPVDVTAIADVQPTDSVQIAEQTIAATVSKPDPPKAPALPKYHTVKRGDSLSSLSYKYGVSVKTLKKINGLKSDMIKIKQKLLIR